MATAAGDAHAADQGRSRLPLLTLGALGVVYGDIGTSPLYAVRECFHGVHPVPVTDANVFGVLSLIFWALILIVTVKYLGFVLRADNRGEGGILALTTLITPFRDEHPARPRRNARPRKVRRAMLAGGLFGGALLYGDGIITPAISVLSAIEGLEVVAPGLEAYVIPLTLLVIFGLFVVQPFGTGRVGAAFGPIVLTWLIVLGVLGATQIVQNPRVLAAVNPAHAVAFFVRNGWQGILVLGAVVLVVTGGEALYADLGHFGRQPIQLGWFAVALPGLLLVYFGQGALLLRRPEVADHVFYALAPTWARLPLIFLATMATVIASQALISAAFSLTRQAVQLGYSPRVTVRHTSGAEIGQIYIPGVNWALMVACIGLVVGFQSSSKLAAAYGVAVTITMTVTTVLFFDVMYRRWGWSLPAALAVVIPILTIESAFLVGNLVKVPAGGWFPIAVAVIVYTLMTTWRTGRRILARRLRIQALPLRDFLTSLEVEPPPRVPGTAVFLWSHTGGTPPALLHNLKHNKVLHERVVILTVLTVEVPYVRSSERVEWERLGHGFYRARVRYGFMEEPNVPRALSAHPPPDFELDPMQTSYFMGRERLLPSRRPGMAFWRERLFAIMSRNARDAASWFGIPPNRVVELGAQIEL